MWHVKYADDGSIMAAAGFPFSDAEAVDFDIVQGADGRLYKEGDAPVKKPENIETESRRVKIFEELDRIDRASARSLRAILAAQVEGREPVNADIQMLATYEAEAVALREELQGLK